MDDKSILNHLFLPHYLPTSDNDDFLIKYNREYEYKILERMKGYLSCFESADETNQLPIIRVLMDCVTQWSVLQGPQNFSETKAQSIIDELSPGSFLPLYFYPQNAAILIEIEENNIDQPLISSWEVLLSTSEIVSSLVPHFSCFPVTTYRLQHRSQLSTKAHCELLKDCMCNTIEYSKSYKTREVNEIHNVPESHYVCQWWIQQFQGVENESNPNTSIQFKKKHRDQIRWSKGLLPFRRSGLWMTIKVVFHTILTKRLGRAGTVVYKLLITDFLTHVICQTYRSISTDLLVHCIRKIVRRLNKIESLPSYIDSDDVAQWVKRTKQTIQTNINKILPKPDWQKSIQFNEKTNHTLSMNNFELNQSEICQHLCQELNTYLTNVNPNKTSALYSGVNNSDDCVNVDHANYILSIEVLTKKFNYTIGIALTRIENWVESHLDQWINQPTASESEKNCFETLLQLFEDYQSAALNHYYSENVSIIDPMGYSRFILTSLTIIYSMHQKLCNDSRFERLQQHSIHIPNILNLFEFLILPNRDDMIRARNIYDYFSEFSHKPYPVLLGNIDSADAFGVYYASQSTMMIDTLQKIKDQIELEKEQKILEVTNAQERYKNLMDSIKDIPCTCVYKGGYHVTCDRCKIQKEAESIQVQIYECPLPSRHESALAVIFELQMPIEIRNYRDILWQFINRPEPHPSHNMHEWLNVSPHSNKLKPFFTGPYNCKVKLVSSTKSVTQTHYSHPPSIASASVNDFLFESGLKVLISPTKSIQFSDECRALTPQLVHPDYKQLQIAVSNTEFVQNRVIAKLSDCSLRMKTTQFVEFGSFRSGHRLQWWNLLAILEMDSLSIVEESVVILIIHSILQYGPLITDRNLLNCFWCPESHEQLLEDHFIDEFLERLHRHLDDCELNWQNELVLMVITMITMRLLTICNSTRETKVVDLVMKCRRIGEKWIDLISENTLTISSSTFNPIEKPRLKLVTIGISCLLTFSTDSNRINRVLSSNEDVISLLKASTTIHDNIILNKNQFNTRSNFINNIIRLKERVLVMVQPKMTELLEKTSYQSLNDFIKIYWAVIQSKGIMDTKWKKRYKNIYDGWYDCQYESRYLSIDCLTGTFLVDGMTIGFLPSNITTNELFVRVFDDFIFEIQLAESPKTYITKNSYGQVQYEFHFNDQTKCLIINERHIQTKDIFQLIPHSCFKNELPNIFVSNHSHWWNEKDQIVEFRPVHFKDADFLTEKPYRLSLKTGYITTTETVNTQILINQSSTFFQNLFNQYFIRLDDKPHVYMMCDTSFPIDPMIYINLPRLGIAFQYNYITGITTSREYSDMCIDEDQQFGTLTDLTSGLLLSPLYINNHKFEHYPYRKFIVPFGTIQGKRNQSNDHQTVIIDRSSSISTLEYFVFILNDRLHILQSTDSPTGWLYLALLHAMTSHSLPDEYTGMTGMERAFQLLYSAGCWSDQPFNNLSLNILGQIALISPKVSYHPEHLTVMVKIDWNSNGLSYSMQHFGYYLIAKKIVKSSQLFNFMYPSANPSKTPELFQENRYNAILLGKLYWDYRDSYNPTARLSTEMEDDILRTSSTILHQPSPENCSSITNNSAVCLVDDLYREGNVDLIDCSNLCWLPLAQWLTKGEQLKSLWIGLLKLADRYKTEATENGTDNIQRLECLLKFLYYTSKRCNIELFYLQMLKTVLKVSSISLVSVTFPPFMSYQNIEEISILETRIPRGRRCALCQKNIIMAEVERCWKENCEYPNVDDIATTTEKNNINILLNSWRSNKNLRSFLEIVQNLICSVPMEEFNKILYIPQQFSKELPEDHYTIQLKSKDQSIDSILLNYAKQKFYHHNSDYFNKPIISIQNNNDKQNRFPQEIFPLINNQNNPLNELTNYFKTQLTKSWEKFVLDKQNEKEYPSIEEVTKLLNSFREESKKFWNELIKSITLSYEQLFEIGSVTRITPSNVVSIIQQQIENSKKSLTFKLTTDQHTLLGGIIVNWTLEQQMERALYFANHDKWEDFKKEVSHIPHSNWIPSEHIEWLILELEMNITIRETQINVANHMIKPNDSKVQSIVMQMNMGEGKTSVILPMLAVNLSSSKSSLVRIIVLKSLFPTNYQSLKCKLGGLLNRRIFPFSCRRDLNFNNEQINQIHKRFEQGLNNCDIVLTSPEDILSFELLTIDKCRQNAFQIGRSMLILQRWLKNFVRDVLDESDEILHVKYQLIYTIGNQQTVDGGAERWLTIQLILDLVKKHAEDISTSFSNEVFYKPSKRISAFPQFRLQSYQPFKLLCEKIAHDWINNRNYRDSDKQLILSFILKTDLSIDILLDKFSSYEIQLFLIIRGLLSSQVLLIALKKRYRVNYGINTNTSFKRKINIAVPFRAKDVAADRTEFGHPDIAIVLTYLTYYYSGLNNKQLSLCFNRLNEQEADSESLYDEWILYEQENEIHSSIKQWKGVNLKDYQQLTKYLFPTFKFNMKVINYYLNNFVFPQEAKQFPYKLVSSAWDLSSSLRSQIITGFSGTNDTQLLLPIHIRQYDLEELIKTDAIVLHNLLKPENENYQSLTINATSDIILHEIFNNNQTINVILDVGALFIDGTNRDIAMKWLNLSDKNKIHYAVYFNADSIYVCDRQFHHHPFETSPASERLNCCVFYLDDIHTRGTDFKFPSGFKAAVTLGNGLTKDRFVQACMRMRKLGNGHSLTFWSSYEVHQQITTLKKHSSLQNQIHLIDILRWVYENTQQTTWDGLHHWAVQSSSFQRKITAFKQIDWNNREQSFTDTIMKQLAQECLEPEVIELKSMYGATKILQTIYEIHYARYQQINQHLSTEIQETVLKRLQDYGGTIKKRLSQLLDEEHQRELEQEIEEERQIERPPSVSPCEPKLHDEIKRLCDTDGPILQLDQLPTVFRPLEYAFTDTTFFKDYQSNSWHDNFWVSTEFQRVIATKGESLNSFLRPPRWIVMYRHRHLIFVNAFEANWLLGRLNSRYHDRQSNNPSMTTLRLLLPRIKRNQSIFVNTTTLTIPPSFGLPNGGITYYISLEWLVQLFIFNGTLYFETVSEQTEYCQCLSLCPKPRTMKEEEAFQKGWINADGFVNNREYRHDLKINQVRFNSNSLKFVKQLIENRNNSYVPISSHIGSIILNSLKLPI